MHHVTTSHVTFVPFTLGEIFAPDTAAQVPRHCTQVFFVQDESLAPDLLLVCKY